MTEYVDYSAFLCQGWQKIVDQALGLPITDSLINSLVWQIRQVLLNAISIGAPQVIEGIDIGIRANPITGSVDLAFRTTDPVIKLAWEELFPPEHITSIRT